MKKRIFITVLSIMMLLVSAFSVVGCRKNRDFTVTFKSGNENAYLYSGEAVQTVKSSENIVEPVFVCPGYNFVGWDSSISDIKEDKVVTARWAQYKFSVTFYGNGGTLSDGDSVVVLQVDSGINIEPPAFSRTGYTLSWDKDLATITDSCTISAVWTPKEYELSFAETDGANIGGADKIKVIFGAPVNLPDDPVKGGKKFARWIDGNGNPIDYNMGWNFDESVKVYAVWADESEYVIKYDLAGAPYNDNSVCKFNSLTEVISLRDPAWPGYRFTGWTINGSIKKSDEITRADFVGDTVLTANWAALPYRITYGVKSGETLVGETGVEKWVNYGETVGTLPTVEKEGYVFIGWRFNGSFITENTSWIEPRDATLIPVFKRIYTLKFSLIAIVRGNEVECALINNGDVVLQSGQGLEHYSKVVLEGESLAGNGFNVFPIVGGDSVWHDEYTFKNYWDYITSSGTKNRVYADTVFNSENFPDSTESGEVLLRPHVRSNWTPTY